MMKRLIWTLIIAILSITMIACLGNNSREKALYPFKAYAPGMKYANFLGDEGYLPKDATIILEDDQRVWFRLPRHVWHDLNGEIQGIYDPQNETLFDIRFEVYVMDFQTVVEKLRLLYEDISAKDYVAMDTSWVDQPDWEQLTASRYERRVKDGQLALFVTEDYRIEVWNENYFTNGTSSEPTVSIIYLTK